VAGGEAWPREQAWPAGVGMAAGAGMAGGVGVAVGQAWPRLSATVIPAQAGIHAAPADKLSMGPRLRGDTA